MAAVTTIDTRPATVNLNVYAGDDIKLLVTVTDQADAPFDLTGYTAEAQIRANADAPTAIDFTCVVTANTVAVTLPTALSTTMPVKGVWDVQVTSATGAVTTLATGTITCTPEVTRDAALAATAATPAKANR